MNLRHRPDDDSDYAIDWWPLDRTNPTPGDPGALVGHSIDYRAVARKAFDAAEYLRTACTDAFWDSDAGREFRIRCENLAAELLRTVPRHNAAADALDAYIPELEQAQATSLRALVKAQQAQDDMNAIGYVGAKVTVSESPSLPNNTVPIAMPQGGPMQNQYADAVAAWSAARKLWEDAQYTQMAAARVAAGKIGEYTGQDGLSDKEWTQRDSTIRSEVLAAETTGVIAPGLETALNNEADSQEFLSPESWYDQDADKLRALIPTDPAARATWWAGLPDAERIRYLDVGVALLQGLPNVPKVTAYYRARAAADAGIDYDSWDPSTGFQANKANVEKSYDWYRELFNTHPEFQWMGLGRLAGVTVYAGMLDLEDNKGDIIVGDSFQNYQKQLLLAQRAIFVDLGGQHEAYLRGGLPAIEAMANEKSITPEDLAAWKGIASGDPAQIAAANLQFAFREQRVVVPPYIETIHHDGVVGGGFCAVLSDTAQNPVPGGAKFNTLYTNGLCDTDPRWDWVTKSIFPSYQDMLKNHPDQLAAAVNEPLDQAAKKYRVDMASYIASGIFG